MIYENPQSHIQSHIEGQTEPKKGELAALHARILNLSPDCKLWFDDGLNEEGKVVANPTIGYGFQILRYANGNTKDFFQIGLSTNTTGISVYILGIKDKSYLATTYGKDLGKASVTGYCIKFKTIQQINLSVLEAAIKYGFEHGGKD